jgi:hydrogenase expression/formation protein HypD
MRYVDEYRDAEAVRRVADGLARVATRPWTIMEVCGGQTHTILKFGIDELLPGGIRMLHGPGCPVCVTPVGLIDKAVEIASRGEVIFCSFGDMLRVPGSERNLFAVKAAGGDVRMVYSPADAVQVARANPDRQVVFFAVGFETTAPTTAMALLQARREGLSNFSLLVAHVRVPPAMEAILSAPERRVDGFLAAGHVCTVTGLAEYELLTERYHVPIVVTGFEPLDLLEGIFFCVKQLEEGRSVVQNEYARSVRHGGNPAALNAMRQVFQVVSRPWRGIGVIPEGGLGLREDFAKFDAEQRFETTALSAKEPAECISGQVLQGLRVPADCAAFGGRCTPEHPLGAPMVSSEGVCAAYYQYRKAGVAKEPQR